MMHLENGAKEGEKEKVRSMLLPEEGWGRYRLTSVKGRGGTSTFM